MHLLIVGCSQNKKTTPGLLPAIERYDGGSFRVLRKAQREGRWPRDLEALILSAKYGLINASTPIANYDQRMTCEQAIKLRPQVTQTLQTYASSKIDEVYIDVGQDYRPALDEIANIFEASQITFAQGRIGERLSRLKKWLSVRSSHSHALDFK